ncbi:MAG TPA: ATPase, T2SS/T4P/T4SS family, partial [Candidatus Rubrimentiphilum sp.]|nr:ATPase, T2SS/T4P/T4SS family [Candidatus Rubrimentiphilum sp.]
CAAPHGFIVAAGPTGSGKTTTLYAALAERDAGRENLCSVEDPVELRIPGVSQTPIHPRAGVTFASALRAFLRQDPNVIMVGEMRDAETASVAAAASLSGQLVLTTLHSNNAAGAIDRLVELGVSRRTIAAGLSAVVAQRLVRRLCACCREAHRATASIAADFGIPADAQIFRANGCSKCNFTGYWGRSAIFEILVIEDDIRIAIASGTSGVGIDRLARGHAFRPMREHALTRLRAGETSCDELKRVLIVEPAA